MGYTSLEKLHLIPLLVPGARVLTLRKTAMTQGQGICKNCSRAIILIVDRWVHAATGNSTCANGQTEADPK